MFDANNNEPKTEPRALISYDVKSNSQKPNTPLQSERNSLWKIIRYKVKFQIFCLTILTKFGFANIH